MNSKRLKRNHACKIFNICDPFDAKKNTKNLCTMMSRTNAIRTIATYKPHHKKTHRTHKVSLLGLQCLALAAIEVQQLRVGGAVLLSQADHRLRGAGQHGTCGAMQIGHHRQTSFASET